LILVGTFVPLTLAGNTIVAQVGFAVSCGIVPAVFVMAMFLLAYRHRAHGPMALL